MRFARFTSFIAGMTSAQYVALWLGWSLSILILPTRGGNVPVLVFIASWILSFIVLVIISISRIRIALMQGRFTFRDLFNTKFWVPASIKNLAIRLNKWHYLGLWGAVFFLADAHYAEAFNDLFAVFTLFLIVLSCIKLINSCKARPKNTARPNNSSINNTYQSGQKQIVCKSCGFSGNPKEIRPGNGLIEFILWFCYVIPGLIYSVWRTKSQYKVCSSCGSRELIPADSPIGKALLAKIDQT